MQSDLSGITLEISKVQSVIQDQLVQLVRQALLVLKVSLVTLQLLQTLHPHPPMQATHGLTATTEKLMFTLMDTGLKLEQHQLDQQVLKVTLVQQAH
jgi:hypothetical protein